MADDLTSVCAIADVPANSARRFDVGAHALAVYNVGGTIYVTDDECTHGAASLSDGVLDDDIIECTMHFGAFNVRTGEAVQAPCSIALRTYKVVVQDGKIFIDLAKTAKD
jgi:nitrite reductase/ring-hydroxylating ferredoxin subunit